MVLIIISNNFKEMKIKELKKLSCGWSFKISQDFYEENAIILDNIEKHPRNMQ